MPARTPARPPAAADHRTQVARERRARTQARIIEGALDVFARKGPDGAVIDDFIRAAGVARGTFYNYYKSTEELLAATTKWLEDDLMVSIETEIAHITDPVERLTSGVRMWLNKAKSEPEWCAFIVRVRWRGPLVEHQLTTDLKAGMRSGQFDIPGVDAARDLVVGTILEAMRRIVDDRPARSFDQQVTRVILRGLGLDPQAIARQLARPVPTMRRPSRSLA